MTNNEIITTYYKDILTIIKNICTEQLYQDDLIQEILLILLQSDNNLLNQLISKKELNYYVARIVKNNWNSNKSSFYYKYKRKIDDRYIDYINNENLE